MTIDRLRFVVLDQLTSHLDAIRVSYVEAPHE
jgi:hypothetical protein